MKSVALNAYPRTVTRRNRLKRVRAVSRIPGVIYGRKVQPQSVEIDRKSIEDLIHHSVSETRLVDLSIQGDARPKRLALLQEVQHHPLSGQILHVDLHEVSPTEKVSVMIPVETTGEAVGVKTGGGVLEHVLFRIRVRALPADLPEFIQIDVSNLELGKSIHIGDITPPAGVEFLGERTIPVVSVAAPRETVEAAPVEAAPAAGEVEMIKEKKEGEKPEEKAKEEPKASEKKETKAPEKK